MYFGNAFARDCNYTHLSRLSLTWAAKYIITMISHEVGTNELVIELFRAVLKPNYLSVLFTICYLSYFKLRLSYRVCWWHKCISCNDVSLYFIVLFCPHWHLHISHKTFEGNLTTKPISRFFSYFFCWCLRSLYCADGAIFIFNTPVFGLDRNGLDNWPSGKLPKKLPFSFVLSLLWSSQNRSLSLGRECWVRRTLANATASTLPLLRSVRCEISFLVRK